MVASGSSVPSFVRLSKIYKYRGLDGAWGRQNIKFVDRIDKESSDEFVGTF